VCDAAGGLRQGLILGRSALRADSAAMLGAGSRRATRCANGVRCARTGAASQTTRRAEARRPRSWPCRPRRALRPGRSQVTSRPPDDSCPCSPSRRPRNRPRRSRLPRRHHGGLRTDMPAPLSAQRRRGTDMRFIELQFSSGLPEPPLNSGADTGPGTSPRCFRFMSLAGGSPHALWSRPPAASAKVRPGRPQRACEAPRNAGLVAARVSALRGHTRRACPSAANAVSVASCATGHGPESRRGVGAQRRPPR